MNREDGLLRLGEIKAIASAVLLQMERLGLLWRLRPATVNQIEANGAIRATIDGDTQPIRVVSMVGPVAAGARVMVLTTPPAGNHVVGWVGPPAVLGAGVKQLWGQPGRASVSFGPATSFTQVVPFGRTYPVIPRVIPVINSGAGITSNWHVRAIGATTTQFTLFGFGPSTTWGNVAVDWVAYVA